LTLDEKAWFGPRFYPNMKLAPNGIDPNGNFNIKVGPLRNDPGNTLRDELDMVPMDLYKGFFDNLEANSYTLDDYDSNHNEGENLFCFTYDWRRNNNTSAQLLSEFIDSVRVWTGSEKINLIGHSMGGTVAKTCIKKFDKSRIEKAVFIGTPNLGAPEVLTVMIRGKLFEWLGFIVDEFTIRELARNYPALYQMIPSMSYFNLNINNGLSSGIEVYSQSFQLPNNNFANYMEMIQYLKSNNFYQTHSLNDALIDSAETFIQSISEVDFGSVQVFNIVGVNILTIGKNKVISQPITGIKSIEESRNINGDYTVPFRSAEIINDQVFDNTYYIPEIIHSALPSSEEVLQILLGVFNDPPNTNFPQYANPPQSYVTDVKSVQEIPLEFYLSQNFPNPFNPITKISYSLPTESQVKVYIYNPLGELVEAIVNERQNAGKYEAVWNADNHPSGVYIYTLSAVSVNGSERTKISKKMILLK
jgi:pimeloyl-ACP methyl ester carboxylesterase